jgi:hypothetical protein
MISRPQRIVSARVVLSTVLGLVVPCTAMSADLPLAHSASAAAAAMPALPAAPARAPDPTVPAPAIKPAPVPIPGKPDVKPTDLQNSETPKPDPEKAKPVSNLADLGFEIQCVQVMDEPQARLESLWRAIGGNFEVAGHRVVKDDRKTNLWNFLTGSDAPKQAIGCDGVDANNPLIGAGQLTVFVLTSDYAAVEKAIHGGKHPDKTPTGSGDSANTFDSSPGDEIPAPHLVLNGFDMGAGGEHLATEQLASGYTALRFQLVPDKDSDRAWATLYRASGFTQFVELRPALAWNGQTVFRTTAAPKHPVTIAVTDKLTLVEAVVVAAAFLAVFFRAMYRMDVFRESPALPWWDEADLLRDKVRACRLGKKSRFKFLTRSMKGIHAIKAQMAGMSYWAKGTSARALSLPAGWHAPLAIPLPANESPEVIKIIQSSSYGGNDFSDSNVQACLEWANKAICGNYPEADADVASTVIGLALTRETWKPVRGAFSLASVQVGVWMMFACISAIFLWVVSGALPAIVGSLLGLVSITVAISGASWMIDPAAKKFLESQGLWRDLMMGADGQTKVHRFQAVLVNLLLLFVGVAWLTKNLTYPTFDDTWLQFLGLSGLAQTVGKAVNEGSKPGT